MLARLLGANPYVLLGSAILIFLLGVAGGYDLARDRELARVQEVGAAVIEAQMRGNEISQQLEVALVEKASNERALFAARKEARERDAKAVYERTACDVPVRFVSLWDSAGQGQPADASSLVDASPSGLTLAQVEDQHELEAAAYRQCAAQVKGWQQFYKEVSDAYAPAD